MKKKRDREEELVTDAKDFVPVKSTPIIVARRVQLKTGHVGGGVGREEASHQKREKVNDAKDRKDHREQHEEAGDIKLPS